MIGGAAEDTGSCSCWFAAAATAAEAELAPFPVFMTRGWLRGTELPLQLLTEGVTAVEGTVIKGLAFMVELTGMRVVVTDKLPADTGLWMLERAAPAIWTPTGR